jgi:tetratricopeptide (TPR) repeat protein
MSFATPLKVPGPKKLLVTALMAGSVMLGAASMSGCSSSEDRQAKYLERAQTALEKGDFDKARVDLKNVLQINAGNAQARLLFAKLEERQKNWPQMYANLNAAIEADPTLLEARIKLAELLIAANQPEDARKQIDKILAQERTTPKDSPRKRDCCSAIKSPMKPKPSANASSNSSPAM